MAELNLYSLSKSLKNSIDCFRHKNQPTIFEINCFMGTNLDILVIEDFILFKDDQDKSLLKDYKNKFELD